MKELQKGETDHKEAIECPKCRTKDFDSCHSMRCPMRALNITDTESQDELWDELLKEWHEVSLNMHTALP